MRNRRLAVETLEHRTLLTADVAVEAVAAIPGDANLDGSFDQMDVVEVLQTGKYMTGVDAVWSEGDWNSDGAFDQLDLVEALQTGMYGVENRHVFAAKGGPKQEKFVPLKGTMEGEFVAISETEFVYSGVGQLSHLGRVTETGTSTFNGVNANGQDEYFFVGSFMTVAGEELAYEGIATITEPFASYTSTWDSTDLTDSTGRFEGAVITGTSMAELAPINEFTLSYTRVDVGMISVPRWRS